MADAQALIGKTVSHYRIVEVIGSGGMGVVYRAHDEQLDRDVAVKVLPHERISDEGAQKRFRKEALALARMNHANIETVHEFASEDGIDYLFTEYIQGKTLTELIRGGPLVEKEVVALGTQIAAALEEAHERGIVHCDLKPANIIVTGKRHVKVLDFGLATLLRAPGEGSTQAAGETGMFAGTLPYMAPEQLTSKGADARTDVYALGLVLYEMVTGLRAFQHESAQVLVGMIVNQMPPPARRQSPNTSVELERIIFKACDKDAERRYQTARELRIDLERLATPSTANVALRHSDTVWQGIWNATRRNPRRLAVSVVVVGLAIASLVWFLGARPVLSFAPRDWILLTDFDNQTGEAVFDRSLMTALTVSLEQSAHANIFPRARIPDTLKRMNKPVTAGIDESIGREICLREHIRGLLSCRIAKIGQEYLVSAQLIDPQNGVSVKSYLERAKGPEGVLSGLDRIANQLRRDLGESLGSIQADNPLPQVTTSSLQALKDYSDGSEEWRRGKYAEAMQLYKSAIELDSDFAMAHAALGGGYYSFIFNDPVDGKAEYEKALQASTRTTERERLTIELGYASAQKHEAEASKQYEVYLDKYPDDWRMRSNFASELRDTGRFQDAIEQYLQVLRIAPEDAAAQINLATSYSGLGNVDEALRSYDKAFELEPTWKTTGNLNHEYGFALVRKGDDAGAAKVFELALKKPEMKGAAERSLGWLALYHGQYKAAKEHFETALLTYKANKTPLSEARTHILLAIVADGQEDRVGVVRNVNEAQTFLPGLGPKVWMGSLIACLYARAGAPEKAEQVLQSIKPVVDFQNGEQSSQYHRLEGEIALARGNGVKAIESFKLAQTEKSGPQTIEAVARATAKAGDRQQSISWYEKLIGVLPEPLGWEPQQDWLEAHYRLAEEYLQNGQPDKAAPLFKKLAELWKDADADLAMVKRLHSEYAKLQ